MLDKEHIDTLDSKHKLAIILYRQQKYIEAEELFQQVVQGGEKLIIGREHNGTLSSKHWLAYMVY
jgi:hypothetical protein